MMAAPVVDQAARELALVWFNRLEGDRLVEPLPDPCRAILKTRYLALDVAFRGHVAGVEEPYIPIVAQMLHIYSKAQRGDKTTHSYAYVLAQDMPAPVWAVADAAKTVQLGEIPYPDFPPLPGLLRRLAWQVARPFWMERMRIGKVLKALMPRVPEAREKREQVAARIRSELRNRFAAQSLAQVSCSAAAGSQGVCEVSCATALDLDDF